MNVRIVAKPLDFVMKRGGLFHLSTDERYEARTLEGFAYRIKKDPASGKFLMNNPRNCSEAAYNTFADAVDAANADNLKTLIERADELLKYADIHVQGVEKL